MSPFDSKIHSHVKHWWQMGATLLKRRERAVNSSLELISFHKQTVLQKYTDEDDATTTTSLRNKLVFYGNHAKNWIRM